MSDLLYANCWNYRGTYYSEEKYIQIAHTKKSQKKSCRPPMKQLLLLGVTPFSMTLLALNWQEGQELVTNPVSESRWSREESLEHPGRKCP